MGEVYIDGGLAGERQNRTLDTIHFLLFDARRGNFIRVIVRVASSRLPDGLWAEPVPLSGAAAPVDAAGEDEAPRGLVIAFPSLKAAAGGAGAGVELEPEAERIRLRLSPRATGKEVFAVRAAGDSMDGGREPIRDGDWLVMRYAREMRLGGLEGRIALVQVPDAQAGFGHAFQVKRVVRQEGRWTLRSDNPARPSFAASAETVPIAVLVEVLRPEAMAPEPGDRIAAGAIGKAFGLEGEPAAGQAARVEGHLFLLVEEKGRFTAPDRLRWEVKDRRPGETAFVLVRAPGEEAWRYLGVGRWIEAEGAWGCPELDYTLWRALGEGRGASRRLPEEYREKARTLAERTLERFPAGSVVEPDGKRFRIVGRSAEGGLRIDGGPGGFEERTVSTTDLGWVLLAVATTGASAGQVDEATVNRLRYVEGTPKESTRWIDTGWAIRISRL